MKFARSFNTIPPQSIPNIIKIRAEVCYMKYANMLTDNSSSLAFLEGGGGRNELMKIAASYFRDMKI
jgi:hypothetical protein